MSSRYVRLAVLVAVLCGAWRGLAQPSLGSSVASYAVLGRTSVTNSGPTIIAGNVGASAGGVTGDPLHFVIGEVRTNDALARQAQEENAAAYAALATLLPCTMIGGDLSGQTFKPGVYCLSSPAELSETLPLTIDAGGNPDGPWIFRTDSLTTAPGSIVQTTNGAKEGHVFWRVAGQATFGARSVFLGNVLALGNITVNNRGIVSGRLLSQTGTVTLDDAGVTICCELLTIEQRALPNGTIDTPYAPDPLVLTATGGKPPYQFAVVAGQLPPGLTLAANGALSGTPKEAGAFKVAIAVTDSVGFSCIRVYTIAICGPITLSELPDPVACISYDKTIFATDGTPPYKYAIIVGKRPDGLDGLNDSLSGRLFGTPTQADDRYDFTVTATDALGCKGSRRYMGPITGGLKLLPNVDTLPEGTVGVDYNDVLFEVTGGTGPFTFSFSDTVPPGLFPLPGTLPSTITLSGLPSMGGCYRFTVTVKTAACPRPVSRDYNLVIRPVPVVTFSPDSLPPGIVCTRYCKTISVNACTNDYVFAALPSGVLPPGLVFDRTTGKLCGTPKKPGKYGFTIVATNPAGDTARHPYEIEILCPGTITIDPLSEATACVRYEHQLKVTGCDYPITFSEIPETPLPGDLDVSLGGLVSGDPPQPGTYPFDVLVTPKDCPPTTVHLSLKVLCVITISPPTLPSGRIGKPYSQTLTACGGTAPYIFSIAPGSPPPPPGITPFVVNGTLSGTPTNSGCFTFRVRATDSVGCFAEQTYTVCILPAGAGSIGAPALSGWGMMILTLLLVAAGVGALRRPGW